MWETGCGLGEDHIEWSRQGTLQPYILDRQVEHDPEQTHRERIEWTKSVSAKQLLLKLF